LRSYEWRSGDWVDIDQLTSRQWAPTIPGELAACNLLRSEEASSFLGASVSEPAGGTTESQGAAEIPLRISQCTFATEGPPAGEQKSQGLISSLTLFYEAAPSEEDARREYEALVETFGRQSTGRSAEGFGEEAVEFNGLLVARRSNEIIQVQISSRDTTLLGRVLEVARVVIPRAWP
jgi:hypothetical protein